MDIDTLRLLVLSVGGLNVGFASSVMIGFVRFFVKSNGRYTEIKPLWGAIGGVGYVLMMIVTIMFVQLRLGKELNIDQEVLVTFAVMLLVAYLANILFAANVALIVREMRKERESNGEVE